MIGQDFEEKRGSPYCPTMMEPCTAGSTPCMKGARCAAWRGLPMWNKDTNLTKEVFACSVYEWPPQLGYEANGLLQSGRASSDKIANEVANHHLSFVAALDDAQKRRIQLEMGKQPNEQSPRQLPGPR